MNNEKNVLLLSIEESKANLKKRKLWREYKKAKEKARELNNQLSDAWKEKVALKEKIDAAVDKMKVSPEHTNVWRSFHDFKEMKSKEIAGIIAKANHEHGLMLEEFDLAKNEETGSGAAFAHRRKASNSNCNGAGANRPRFCREEASLPCAAVMQLRNLGRIMNTGVRNLVYFRCGPGPWCGGT